MGKMNKRVFPRITLVTHFGAKSEFAANNLQV